MDLEDLNEKERLALVALVRATVLGDRVASDEEADEVHHIVAALGEEAYQRSLDEAERRFPDEAALRTYLQAIDRQEAREEIYATVVELAMIDTVALNGESELLAWLAEVWKIEVEYQEPLGA